MKNIFLIVFLIFSAFSFSQRNVKDSTIGSPLIGVHYGGNWTSVDLAERYGYFNHVGVSAGYKTKKNWYYGLDANFLFGNQTRMTGIFDHLVDDKGNITDVNGDIAAVVVFPRGVNANVSF
jgi:hypothetical protein